MADATGGDPWGQIGKQLLEASPPLMLRSIAFEAVATVIVQNIPDIAGTDWDLWATQTSFGAMGLCGLVMFYAMLRGK